MSEQKRVCVFCGGVDLTREHVPPAWIKSYIPDGGVKSWSKAPGDEDGLSKTLGQAPLPISQTFRTVCGDCNNGWMSRLEDRTRPILGPMIMGRGTRLSPMAQQTLASWLTKTALVVGSKNHARFREAYDLFFEFHAPTDDDRYLISIGTFGPNNDSVDLRFFPYPVHKIVDGRNAYYSVFQFTILIGHFFGSVVFGHPAVQGDIAKPNPAAVSPIWPRDRTFITWPDRPYLSIDLLEDLKKPPRLYTSNDKGAVELGPKPTEPETELPA